ncbi:lipopolysaccharide biosynthesis protein [Aurantiacibacter spongiae]|uniref:lipopolysaccharide biosynthesis protein n=1 Tax=Aurantiacibacter spongiae TaxID=2488860 RepID=UPI0013153DA0|nr:polysaccharide biosynthesis C-terminal domain-containing protein [Aurantiacibacter spongiae]
MASRLGRLRFELILGLVLRGASAVTGFALVWLIVQVFGAEVVGLYQLGIVTMTLSSVLACQGLDRILVRDASVAIHEGNLAEGKAKFLTACTRILCVGIPLTVLIVVFADPLANRLLREPAAAVHLRILAPALVTTAIIRVSASLLRARGDVMLSQSLDGWTYSGIAAIVVGSIWLSGMTADARLPAAAYLGGTTIVMTAGLIVVVRMTRGWTVDRKAALSVAPGLRIAGFNALAQFNTWIGLALLTASAGAASAGIFRVGFQFCLLFTLINSSFAMMIGPHIARAAAVRDAGGVKGTLRTATLLGCGICLPLLLGLMVFAEDAMRLFGPDFIRGANALRVLAAGQFLNVAFGPVGAALTMMKSEKAVLRIEVVATAAGVLLTIVLIPPYGMLGAAIGATSAIILRNTLSFATLRFRLRRI